MKKKFTIRIERRETFVFDVDVEANGAVEAIRSVEKHYVNGEFNDEKELFYSPSDVEDYVYEV